MKGRQREAANSIRGHWIFLYRPQQERRGNKVRRASIEETRETRKKRAGGKGLVQEKMMRGNKKREERK